MIEITITDQEEYVLELLGKIWNEFLTMETLHPSEKVDFMNVIHDAQRIILSRGYLRQTGRLLK